MRPQTCIICGGKFAGRIGAKTCNRHTDAERAAARHAVTHPRTWNAGPYVKDCVLCGNKFMGRFNSISCRSHSKRERRVVQARHWRSLNKEGIREWRKNRSRTQIESERKARRSWEAKNREHLCEYRRANYAKRKKQVAIERVIIRALKDQGIINHGDLL